MQIVWFKRDLRVQDHRALIEAARHGDVLPIYIVEPDLWRQPDASARQWEFVCEALRSLQSELGACGQPLMLATGDACAVLSQLHADHQIGALWSHQETGNAWTYARDQKVADWCRQNGIPWHEIQNHGVERGPSSRDGWAQRWDRLMAEPKVAAPLLKPVRQTNFMLPSARDLGLHTDICQERQAGGRKPALHCLESFLNDRGETYRSAMSSPVAGERACSRLSPHLAWGTLSMREVAQATWQSQREAGGRTRGTVTNWRQSLSSFNGRLHWHCHFIQKLEDEPRIEYANFHRAYDGIRPIETDSNRLHAWTQGETGLPFVDACMRYLRATGWLNFRMRAMVMAVASYHLWLHWRDPGLALARLFTDYEPGIHWSQVQMQSGTTGINTVRIYNPVKQGHDQDPTGAFTRRWIPELSAIPDENLQEPWTADNAAAILGKTYPERIVDHLAAARFARDQIWAVRRGSAFRQQASAIQAKHGSRKSGIPNRGKSHQAKPRRRVKQEQLDLNLDLADNPSK